MMNNPIPNPLRLRPYQRPDFRALYYLRDFNPTHYRRKDGMRVEVVDTHDGQTVYHDQNNTFVLPTDKFNARFGER